MDKPDKNDNFLVKFRPTSFEEVVGQEAAIKILRNIIITGSFLPGILFSGVYGIGKTSLAKLLARALLCEKRLPETCNPCNDCTVCKSSSHAGRYTERNCAMLTTEHIQHDLFMCGEFRIVYYDEFQRVKIPAQEMFLKALEGDPYPVNKLCIFSTTEPEKVDGALLERVTHLKLVPPSLTQLEPWFHNICDRASIHIEDESALSLIAEECNRIPRLCLKFLYEHCVLGRESVSKKIVAKAGTIDSITQERITSRTKF